MYMHVYKQAIIPDQEQGMKQLVLNKLPFDLGRNDDIFV